MTGDQIGPEAPVRAQPATRHSKVLSIAERSCRRLTTSETAAMQQLTVL